MEYVLDRFEENSAVFVSDGGEILVTDAEPYRQRREGDVFILIENELVFSDSRSHERRGDVLDRFKALLNRRNDDGNSTD